MSETYERVGRETGIDPGFRRVGSLTVARTEERFREIRMPVSIARDAGLPSEIVDRDRIRDAVAGAVVDDLVGGVFFPDDGTINPGSAALALARAAVDRGVRYVPGTDGHRVPSRPGRTTRDRHSTTAAGDVEAEVVVLAAGLWTSELARLADASVALYPAEHVWVMTEETPAATEDLPVPARSRWLPVHPPSRRPVRHRCVRAEWQAVGAIGRADRRLRRARAGLGAFRPGAGGGARRACRRSRDLGFGHFLRGPESFTPDANLQLGFVPEVPGLFVAAGLNSQGIIFGPGVGSRGARSGSSPGT